MPQIGVPQKSIQEVLADGFPATTPAAAGRSSFILGQNLTEALSQRELGRPVSDKTPIAAPYRVSVGQPDLPVANVKTGTLTPSTAVDASGNRIIDSDLAFSNLTTGGAFDIAQTARTRAIRASKVENATVMAAPRTGGFGAGYGAMSGGTPAGAASDGLGNALSTQGNFAAAINRTGSRNHASINVIARPGASAPFLH